MTYKVSITDFRNNLTNYIDLALSGKNVTVRDEKKGVDLVKIIKADEELFDWNEYLNWINNFKPFLSGKGIASMKKFRRDFNNHFEK